MNHGFYITLGLAVLAVYEHKSGSFSEALMINAYMNIRAIRKALMFLRFFGINKIKIFTQF